MKLDTSVHTVAWNQAVGGQSSATPTDYAALARGNPTRAYYAKFLAFGVLGMVILAPMAISIVSGWRTQYAAMVEARPITETVRIEDVLPGREYVVDGLVFTTFAPLTNPSVHTLADGRRCEVAGDTLQALAANIGSNTVIRCEVRQ